MEKISLSLSTMNFSKILVKKKILFILWYIRIFYDIL